MNEKLLPDLSGSVIFFVGIKGTGMTALAELLRSRGAIVTGSDVGEKFYTDSILADLGIHVFEEFKADNLPESTSLLVHSAAYSPEQSPEIRKAAELGIRILSYPQALGLLSVETPAAGIAGVHGKTTTTAMIGTLVKELELPASVLTGSAAANFGGRSTFIGGDSYFIAETCEYRRNFLNFNPDYLIITSVEADHLDYYKDEDDVLSAFIEYGRRLPEGGRLIYCADEAGASRAASEIGGLRPDLSLIPYGFSAEGGYRVSNHRLENELQIFNLEKYGDKDFALTVPGSHNVLNAAASAALVGCILDDEGSEGDHSAALGAGLKKFRGTKRRTEIIGDASGVLVIDDYGHHPSAIRTTLDGLRSFYPDRRIIVDFMSHTYSRTEALLDDFADSFGSADMVILHKIYASAREQAGTVRGEDLFRKTGENHGDVKYFEEVMDAWDYIEGELRAGDLFVTMGAGDNWKLGYKYYQEFTEERQGCIE